MIHLLKSWEVKQTNSPLKMQNRPLRGLDWTGLDSIERNRVFVRLSFPDRAVFEWDYGDCVSTSNTMRFGKFAEIGHVVILRFGVRGFLGMDAC